MNKIVTFLARNWKTSITGLVMAAIAVLQSFGVATFTESQMVTVMGFLTALGLVFSKDADRGAHSEPTDGP